MYEFNMFLNEKIDYRFSGNMIVSPKNWNTSHTVRGINKIVLSFNTLNESKF